jgi:hypothetical protein
VLSWDRRDHQHGRFLSSRADLASGNDDARFPPISLLNKHQNG